MRPRVLGSQLAHKRHHINTTTKTWVTYGNSGMQVNTRYINSTRATSSPLYLWWSLYTCNSALLLLCLCGIFQVLINSLVGWFQPVLNAHSYFRRWLFFKSRENDLWSGSSYTSHTCMYELNSKSCRSHHTLFSDFTTTIMFWMELEETRVAWKKKVLLGRVSIKFELVCSCVILICHFLFCSWKTVWYWKCYWELYWIAFYTDICFKDHDADIIM